MLHVYRASAGSGKTYKLTLEYLKLLLSPVRPNNEPILPSERNKAFQHILAVTFTNKATEEMKRRIIEKLDILAHRTSESEYLNDLLGQDGIPASIEELQKRASEILFTLLHDFSGFNISTIDKFFQQTTRAFTREIGLQGGYNTEIDNSHVLTEAIDRMFFDLENPENKDLLNWLIRFSEEQVEGGKSWGIQRNIVQLAQEIFKEEYKSHSSEIRHFMADKDLLRAYIKKLNIIKQDFESESREIARKATEIMKKAGLPPEDLKGGNRSPFKEFSKWADGNIKEPNASFTQLSDNIENWTTKKTSPDIITKVREIYPELNEYIKQIIACYNAYPFYISVMETRRYIYTLGILSDIDKHIQTYEKEHNILLLSDTTELLNRIIDGSDTPFVYEKTGNRIDHFMIDEFQDTSRMQWNNFFPLIKESNDKGGRNLIVGDVKQSIYRWRNSDWKLLNDELGNQFKKPEELNDHVLETNWRSCINVIQFNNSFFRKASFLLQESLQKEIADTPANVHIDSEYAEKIGKAYQDIYQHISPKNKEKKGHVKVMFLETETEEGEKIDWKNRATELLPQTLKELQDKNISLKDIAILVRSKAEGSLVADCLLKAKAENNDSTYRFDIISDEALFIHNAPIVKLVIGILNYLQNPETEINRILAVYEYSTTHRNLPPETALASYFAEKEKELSHHFDPEIVRELEQLRNTPLFEMCEKIISLFPPSGERNESIFIQAFQDIVLDYTTNHSADPASFLQWWNEQGIKKTITTPDSQNAIRIMTIHKSKGLEFKAVIIPFCDWEIDHNPHHENILWCNQKEPLDDIPLVPIRYGSILKKSLYADAYFNEKMHAYIDNLNIAYVAFTRAEDELLLFTPKPKKEGTFGSLSRLLYYCVNPENEINCPEEKDKPIIDLSAYYDPEKNCYEAGETWENLQTAKEKQKIKTMPEYRSTDPGKRLQLRLHGKGYFGDSHERQHGNLMHEILSNVRYAEDIHNAVLPYIFNGQLSHEEGVILEKKLKTWLDQPEVAPWFSPDTQIINETEILQQKGTFLRPDRVVISGEEVSVIDYKFGNIQKKSYHKQVIRYISLIKEMGFSQVKGYIWYVELGKIVPV